MLLVCRAAFEVFLAFAVNGWFLDIGKCMTYDDMDDDFNVFMATAWTLKSANGLVPKEKDVTVGSILKILGSC